MIKTVLGRKRHGKTTLLIKLLRERAKPALVVSFDTFMVAEFPSGQRFTRARALLNHLVEAGGVDVSRPLILSILGNQEEAEAEFNLFCKICIAHQNIIAIIDEIDIFDSANSQDGEFYKMIHYQGHEFGGLLDLVTASRKPSRISRDLRGQTDEFFLFKMTDSRDLAYIEEDISAGIVEQVRHLPKYSYLKYDVAEESIQEFQTTK